MGESRVLDFWTGRASVINPFYLSSPKKQTIYSSTLHYKAAAVHSFSTAVLCSQITAVYFSKGLNVTNNIININSST